MAYLDSWAWENGSDLEGIQVTSGGSPTVDTSIKRSGAGSLSLAAGSVVYAPLRTTPGLVYSGMGFRIDNYADTNMFAALRNGTANLLQMQLSSERKPILNYGWDGTLATSTFIFDFDIWYYIELYWKAGGVGTGQAGLRIDGDDIYTLASAETRGASDHSVVTIDRVTLSCPFTAGLWIDDLIVNDDAGSRFNSWPNGMRFKMGAVVADGTHTGWTGSGANPRYQYVDEDTPSSSDYVETATDNTEVSFDVDDISGDFGGNVEILGVQPISYMHEVNETARQPKHILVVGGNDYEDTDAFPLTTSMQIKRGTMHEENPDTAAPWDVSDLAALEVGVNSKT